MVKHILANSTIAHPFSLAVSCTAIKVHLHVLMTIAYTTAFCPLTLPIVMMMIMSHCDDDDNAHTGADAHSPL